MPTFLVHGFRWQRQNIRIHIILHDLEDAAPEWVVAPATSVTLLNSFYSLYDFLPPSNPPPASYPLPAPTEKIITKSEDGKPKALTKKKGSIASLGSLGRKSRPAKLEAKRTNGNGNGHHVTASSESGTSRTTSASRDSKGENKPTFNDWSVVKFVEQYDPNDLSSTSQPYAYVGDYMVEVKLGASVNEEIAKYEARQRAEELPPGLPAGVMSAREIRRKSRRLGWFEKLRDGLQKGADIGWFIVVCGDEERAAPSMDLGRTSEENTDEEEQKTPRSAGLRGFFGTAGRRKNIPQE
ncbi:uncharacterized protein K444DRAFT_547937 [Hyaloscypha bicolor E]|uniref:Developmental regulator protein n=1 Tax=Hyaloscypha bicolor E TaxID=1095630 RepID=A0A2J6SJ73_9HELO|nr:uncharacterized protein K444DRAFT_547937 [Hyaloscypha bicolor E]PMD50780.1 hypothetical protein K444DRAFT_547937 [Hyaloscypha bicolor E]